MLLFCHSPQGQSNGMRKSATAKEMEPEKYGKKKKKRETNCEGRKSRKSRENSGLMFHAILFSKDIFLKILKRY